jgi:hypothetical protein
MCVLSFYDQLDYEQLNAYVKFRIRSPKFIWAPGSQLYSLAKTPLPPPPAFGRYWSAKIDDIYLGPPRGLM